MRLHYYCQPRSLHYNKTSDAIYYPVIQNILYSVNLDLMCDLYRYTFATIVSIDKAQYLRTGVEFVMRLHYCLQPQTRHSSVSQHHSLHISS